MSTRRWRYGTAAACGVLSVVTALGVQPQGAVASTETGRGPSLVAESGDPLATAGRSASGVTADEGAGRPLDTRPADGLAVYTTPDPTPADSAAYVYSPSTLAHAPEVLVVDADGSRHEAHAEPSGDASSSGQWWTAALPFASEGVHTVRATATTSTGAEVSGASSYEVVGPDRSGTAHGRRWSAVGPGATGGILAVDPNDHHTLYAASGLASELFVGDASGDSRSWRMDRNLPVAGGYPTALLALPAGHRTRLVMAVNGGNGKYVDDPTYTGKVFTSDDAGAHWHDMRLPDSFVRDVLATADGRTLVAVTDGGIETTTDLGAHWRHVDVPWGAGAYSAASLVNGNLYVATTGGLYEVRDVVRTRTGPHLVFTPPGQKSAWVDGVAGDTRSLFTASPQGGIYVSHDSGTTWTKANDTAGVMPMFDDVDGTLYAASGNTILVGRKQGADWSTWDQPVPNVDDQGVVVSGGTVYLGTWDTGFFTTSDQGAHYRQLGGVPDLDVYGLAVTGGPGGGEILAGTDSNVYRSTGAAAAAGRPAAWGPPAPQVAFGAVTPLVAASPDHTVAYKVRSGPRIGTYTVYSSRDAGATWQQLGPTQYGDADALLVDPAAPDDLYVTADSSLDGPSMIVSHDRGATWTKVGLPAPITALAGDPDNPARFWLGGPGGLWVSTDAGASVSRLQQTPVTALTALPGNRLVLGGSALYTSTNGGATLHPSRFPDLDVSVTSLIASPTIPRTLYAATGAFHAAGLLKGGHGVFASVDGGVTWQPYSDGLTDRDVLSLAFSPDGGTLYAGTQRGGVYAAVVGRSRG